MQTHAAILSANYVFEPDYIWENVSQEAIDFIQLLLVTDPNKRPTVKDLQKSEWLTKWANADNDAEAKELSAGVVQALVGFKEKEDMTKLLCEVLSFTLLPGQLEELRKQFELLDPEGRGEISLGALKRALMNNAGAGSLGSLTEEEVEDIFEAMRVRKTEMRIHWHEVSIVTSSCNMSVVNYTCKDLTVSLSQNGFIFFRVTVHRGRTQPG